MRHFPFGHAHVGEYRAELGLIQLVNSDVFAGRESIVVREVKYRAREQDVPVHLRRTIVLRCNPLARLDEMSEVRLWVEREKSVEGRRRQADDVLLEGGKDRGVGSYRWSGVPRSIVRDPGRYQRNICTILITDKYTLR